MLKANMDNICLDILKPAQVASKQIERAAFQMTEEEGVQLWDSSLDEDCSKKNEGAHDVFVSSTHEYIGTPFILIVQATNDKDKYIATVVIQQVYRSSHEKHPRRRAYRREIKFDPYLPIKLKCPKLFEVDDQINLVLQLYEEPTERRRNNFYGPSIGQFLNIYVV